LSSHHMSLLFHRLTLIAHHSRIAYFLALLSLPHHIRITFTLPEHSFQIRLA
jgi:hypothetical protein